MKKILPVIFFLALLTSCQTQVVNDHKPMRANSLDLYQKYTIQTQDAKLVKMEVLRQDEDMIYGKTPQGEEISLNKSDIREVRKGDILSSVLIGLAAVAAVIFVPI